MRSPASLARAAALAFAALALFSQAPARAQAPEGLEGGVETIAADPVAAGEAADAARSSDALGAESLIGDAAEQLGRTLEKEIGALDDQRMSTAVEVAVLLTALSLLPAILITITSFTRIVIVLSFVRRALSTNELPPTPVIIGLSLFLTAFVMAPVGARIHDQAWTPYRAKQVSLQGAGQAAWKEMSAFLVANTRESELELFADLAGREPGSAEAAPSEPLPLRVVVPAFVLSELKTAFQMGFLLFLPFLVVDLVVSTVLLSMGMFMLPPVMISTPFKILLFVLVDGWRLVCESLVTSFSTVGGGP